MSTAIETTAPGLFTPFRLRSLEIRNRIGVSPMCMFACVDRSGTVSDWHVMHYGQFAIGGAGLIITEATAVLPDGRVTPEDAGLWSDEHIIAWQRVINAVHSAGSSIGVQLMHAGRKSSTYAGLPSEPSNHRGSVPPQDGGWPSIGASGEPFGSYASPNPATSEDLDAVVRGYSDAARRAVAAGFDLIELHGAHGYLLHEFLSPVTNPRTGREAAESSLLLERVVRAVRSVIPDETPLIVRLSVNDVAPGGLSAEDSARLSIRLQEQGVDMIDCSSGGLISGVEYRPFPGYQVPGAVTVKAAGVPVAAVGMISDAAHANSIIERGQADIVLLGREMLRDPAWPRRAEMELSGAATIEPRYYRAYR